METDNRSVGKYWLSVLFLNGAAMCHMYLWPGLTLCVARWIIGIVFIHYAVQMFGRIWYLLVPGFALNAVVMLANDGYMPVASRYITEGNPLWGSHCQLTDTTRFPILADVLPLGASIGDYLMIAAFLTGVIVLLLRRRWQIAGE